MNQETTMEPLAPSHQVTVPRPKAFMPPEPGVKVMPRWLAFASSDPGHRAITVGLDTVAAVGSVIAAQWWFSEFPDTRGVLVYSWLFVPVVLALLGSRAMYTRKLQRRFVDDIGPVETSVAMAVAAVLTVMLIVASDLPAGATEPVHVRPTDLMLAIGICAAVLLPAVRTARYLTQRHLRRRFGFGTATLIIGSGPIAHQLVTRMRQVPDYGLRPVGLLDDHRPADPDAAGVRYLGTTRNLETIARATQAGELIVAPAAIDDAKLARTAQSAHQLGLRVRVVPRLMDAVGERVRVEHLGGVPLIVLSHTDPRGWQFAVKHASDRILAALGLLAVSPLFVSLAALVRLSSAGPIFFRQPRVGRDGRVFDCLKFRSMRPPSRETGFTPDSGSAPGGVEGEDRRTWIGKIMRKTSLDELPQLLNVLRGEMSLVGPRPERPEFVELFELQVRRYGERHRVKAGMTGWAQVHGLRGQTSIADRAEFDNYYIENWSLILDLKILVLTVLAVMRSAED